MRLLREDPEEVAAIRARLRGKAGFRLAGGWTDQDIEALLEEIDDLRHLLWAEQAGEDQ